MPDGLLPNSLAGDGSEAEKDEGGANRVAGRGELELEKQAEAAEEKGKGNRGERGSAKKVLISVRETPHRCLFLIVVDRGRQE